MLLRPMAAKAGGFAVGAGAMVQIARQEVPRSGAHGKGSPAPVIINSRSSVASADAALVCPVTQRRMQEKSGGFWLPRQTTCWSGRMST